MKHLTVGIFHAEALGKELGKKGTESDIAFYNRKTDDCVYTFMEPVDGKLIPKAEIMSVIDAAIISFESLTPDVGETVLMLDSMKVNRGIVIVPELVEIKQVAMLTKGTSLESFVVKQMNAEGILEYLEKLDVPRSDDGVLVSIDHAFSVRGVGEVMLGFVSSGTVKKHAKLTLVPGDMEAIVRSIQMQDKDFDEAPAGARVGLAIKGPTAEDMKRGNILCESKAVICEKDVRVKFSKGKFYKGEVAGKCHVVVGMQSLPAIITVSGDEALLAMEKPVVYRKGETFLVLDLNADKVHLMGAGKPI